MDPSQQFISQQELSVKRKTIPWQYWTTAVENYQFSQLLKMINEHSQEITDHYSEDNKEDWPSQNEETPKQKKLKNTNLQLQAQSLKDVSLQRVNIKQGVANQANFNAVTNSNKTSDSRFQAIRQKQQEVNHSITQKRLLGVIRSVKESDIEEQYSIDQSEVPQEQYPPSTLSQKSRQNKSKTSVIKVNHGQNRGSIAQSSDYMSNDFEQDLDQSPKNQAAQQQFGTLKKVATASRNTKTLESVSSSQQEPQVARNLRVAPKHQESRKFSLVPFSREVNKRSNQNSNETSKSFEPYETSTHFQTKGNSPSKAKQNVQETQKRNPVRKPIEITPETIITVPPLEERLRVAVPKKMHITRVIENALILVNEITNKVQLTKQADNCSIIGDGSPLRHDKNELIQSLCIKFNLPSEMAEFVVDVDNIQQLREAHRIMSEASTTLVENNIKRESHTQRSQVQRIKISAQQLPADLSQSFDNKSVKGSQFGVGSQQLGGQLLTELHKIQDKYQKVQARYELIRNPYYLTQLRTEIKELQQNLQVQLADHKKLLNNAQKIEQNLQRIEKGKLPLIEGAESQVSGAVNLLNFNSQKIQMTSEKVAQAMRQQEITELKLKENKEKNQKLLLIAQKYNLNVSQVKDCLRGAPDPLLKDSEIQLKKALEAQEQAQITQRELQKQISELLNEKQQKAVENEEYRDELQQKVNKAKEIEKLASNLRKFIDREGSYNVLQLEKFRKDGQILLGQQPEVKVETSEPGSIKSRGVKSSSIVGSPNRMQNAISESIFLTQNDPLNVELSDSKFISDVSMIKSDPALLKSHDGRKSQASVKQKQKMGKTVEERSQESERSSYSSDKDQRSARKLNSPSPKLKVQPATKAQAISQKSLFKKPNFLKKN